MAAEHTSRTYEHELRALRDKLLLMGGLAEEMVRKAVQAYATRDPDLARATMRLDRKMNQLECDADELSMRILATRQPVASDLRFITTSLKVVTDLERIGDLAVNVCDRAIELCAEPPLAASPNMTALAEESMQTLHEALDALVARDEGHAMDLLGRDDSIDERYAEVFQALLELMTTDASTVYRATRVQSIAKYLERVADHAMNIAEDVVFLVRGKDIRHPNRRHAGDEPPR